MAKLEQMLRSPAITLTQGALRRIAIAGAVMWLLWLAGLVWFATPPRTELPQEPTDAIVVLTGGSMRLQSGLELLREGKGRRLFISGVNQQVELDDLLRVSGNFLYWIPDWAACCVVLGHEASNTLGNARETAWWMRQQGFHSLRLVTAWYHMPRSRLEFGRAMPDIEIVAHPVFPDQVKQEHWWAWRGTAALMVGEYVKYLGALARPVLEGLPLAAIGASEATQAELRR
ncbi:MAG: YdcF family protein [Stellaceae bacterium]|jgi:uncharacterized SAM-binding protein YcdF (DUF218 family)